MREVASIAMLILGNGDPGVRLSAGDDFMDLGPSARVALLMAVVQLCGAAMVSICADNPDEGIDLEEIMEAMTISPSSQGIN